MSEQNEKWLKELMMLAEGSDNIKTEKQARIVEAAIEIFSEKGFAAASTSEIAQKAGVAEGTIFRHYKTKKDLLISIAGPIAVKMAAPFLMREFASKILDLPHEQFRDLLRTIAKDRLQFVRDHFKLLRILIHEIPFQPELLEQTKALFKEIVLKRMEEIIIHFQKKGQVIEAPPWRILRTTASIFIGMVGTRLLLMPDEDIDEDEEIERTLDLIMYGLSPHPNEDQPRST